MECRICGNPTHLVETLNEVPKNVQQLTDSPEPLVKHTTAMDLYLCELCEFVQTPMILKDDYYEDYLMTTSFSQHFLDYLDFLAQKIATAHHKPKIIEIGCGDGAFLEALQRAGCEIVLGIEPSEISAATASLKGFKILNKYIDAETKLDLEDKNHVIVSRQVFEHVADLKGLMTFAKKHGRYLYVEVPSADKSLVYKRFYDFFPDHVNYFSKRALRNLAEYNNCSLTSLEQTFEYEYLLAEIHLNHYNRNYRQVYWPSLTGMKELQTEGLDALLSSYGLGVIWGAGAKGMSTIPFLTEQHLVKCVFDSDPNKQGKYIPGTQIQVRKPNIVDLQAVDLVIITALAYRNAIFDHLHTLGFSGRIEVLGE